MNNETSKESYDSLFTPLFNTNTKVHNKNIVNKKIEQKDIINRNQSFSREDEEGDDSSFEDAAEEPSTDESTANEGGGDESGGDDWGDEGSDDWGDSGDESGSDGSEDSEDNGDNEGINSLDNNKGSSLNPFTQINQKLYHIDRLNELLNSINHTIDLYNVNYAEWSEVDQLKELKSIVANEQKSFVMQQNPENLIKLGLYYEQYDKIVQNISKKISRINSNNKD
jgi:hypothetical protein